MPRHQLDVTLPESRVSKPNLLATAEYFGIRQALPTGGNDWLGAHAELLP